MKQIAALWLILTLPCVFVMAQASTPAPAKAAAASDVYHVQFNKAALGRAGDLAKTLAAGDPDAPMPGHFIVLRHQEGDDWDYCIIEHIGAKATVDTSPSKVPIAVRDQSAWHGDTFVSGPSWDVFTKAMGIDAPAKTSKAVYTVGAFRAAPGHREQLQQSLQGNSAAASKVETGTVMMQHLEGGPWNFLVVTRYNSWQDLATDRSAPANPDGWNQTREHVAMHHDTIADRIAPK